MRGLVPLRLRASGSVLATTLLGFVSMPQAGASTLITECQPLIPTFSVSNPSPVVGEPVTLTADAGMIIDPNPAWDLGNTVHLTGNPLQYAYPAAGTYSIILTATEAACGTAQLSFPQAIVVTEGQPNPDPAPTPGPTPTPSPGCQPNTPSFLISPASPQTGQAITLTADTNLIVDPNPAWDLGNGVHLTGNPLQYTYTTPGAYQIILTATEAACATSQLSAPQSIVVGEGGLACNFNGACEVGEGCGDCVADCALIPAFSASTTIGGVGQSITFTADVSLINEVAPTWSFGDGTTLEGQQVTHSYGAQGSFAVVLTATENACQTVRSSHPTSIFIEPPSCDFSDLPPDQTFCCGDGICQGRENPNNCAFDCPALCGDGLCTPKQGETPEDCDDCCFSGTRCEAGCALVPAFTMSDSASVVAEPVVFSAFPDKVLGQTVNWDFGDGHHCVGCSLTEPHAYEAPGLYEVKLTATESLCGTAQKSFPQYLRIRDRALFKGDRAVVVSADVPATLACGEGATATVTMQNLGTTTWTAQAGYALGANSTTAPYVESAQMSLPGGIEVPSLASATFQIPLLAPDEGGTYRFAWQMLHEGQGWFGEVVDRVVVVSGCGGPAPIPTAPGLRCVVDIRDGYGRPFTRGARPRVVLTTSRPGKGEDAFIGYADGTGHAEVIADAYEEGTAVERMECAVYDMRQRPEKRSVPEAVVSMGSGIGPSETLRLDVELAPEPDETWPVPGLDRTGIGAARLYLPRDGSYAKAIVIPEPMDFHEQDPLTRRDAEELWLTFDLLLPDLFEKGVAVWLVEPFQTGQSIHEQAGEYAQGLREAARYRGGPAGGKVVAAGYSLGGIVTRIATARWEADPEWRKPPCEAPCVGGLDLPDELPVSLIVFGDAPLRGAQVNEELSEMIWENDKAGLFNLNSCAAQQMIQWTPPGKGLPSWDVNWRNFYVLGQPVSYQFKTCATGPAVFSINGDGFAHSAPIAAFSAGTWADANTCYGDSRDRNSLGADLCPHDPGGTERWLPSVNAPFLSWDVQGCPIGNRSFRASPRDLVSGSRFPGSFDGMEQTASLLPPGSGWGAAKLVSTLPIPWATALVTFVTTVCPTLNPEVVFEQFFAPTFIPITSALAADAPSLVPFAPSNVASADHNASHDVLPDNLKKFFATKLSEAFSGTLNVSPTIAASIQGDAQANGSLQFSAVGSTDPDGAVQEALWDFGDGSQAVGLTASHQFTNPGVYAVSVSVVDDAGGTSSDRYSVRVGELPAANTPVGAPVTATPKDPVIGATRLSVKYPQVLSEGTTVVKTVAPPDGASLSLPAIVYQLTTTARYVTTSSEALQVCVDYSGLTVSPERTPLLRQLTEGTWLDVTTELDLGGSRICGLVSSLADVALENVFDQCGSESAHDHEGSCGYVDSCGHAFGLPTDPGCSVLLTANAGGPYSGGVGQPVAFAGSGSSNGGSPIAYTWGFGDGGIASGATASHTYASEGTYTVTLAIADDQGAIGVATTTATIAANPASLAESVVWTSMVGASASGNNLTKTAAPGWTNAGAVSTKAIGSGAGWVEVTVDNVVTNRVFGLSNGNTDASLGDIDFALAAGSDGPYLYIFEKGVPRGSFGVYAAGDRLRVSVADGVVRYWRNGNLIYSSTAPATYPLLVDTSLYDTGSALLDATLSGSLVEPPPPQYESVMWTSVVGASASGNNLTKTAAPGWTNAGAVSTKAIGSGAGWVEVTVDNVVTNRVFGLSNGNTDASLGDIDFALAAGSDGPYLYIFEKGVPRGSFGVYAAGDRLRVSVADGVVRYWRNGNLIYSSTVPATYPLLVDTSLYDTGSALLDATLSGSLVEPPPPQYESVMWTSVVGASASGNNLTKTAAPGWTSAGAVSTKAIGSGAGWVEVTVDNVVTNRVFGLSNGNTDASLGDIDFALAAGSDGPYLYIFEKGVPRGSFGVYAAGDRLRVSVADGVVRYWRNGNLIYSSTVPATYPLLVDTSLYDTGSALLDATLSGSLVEP